MKTLEALQRDIDTSSDLQSIVHTMKVLAAVSIRQYERAQQSLQQYNQSVEMGLQVLLQQRPTLSLKQGTNSHALLGVVIFGSDHGLCGRYNENIAEFASHEMDKINEDQLSRRILVIGNQIETSLQEMGLNVETCFWVPGTIDNITGTVQKILLQIDNWQQEGVNQIMLFNHTHQQQGQYYPSMQQLLPFDMNRLKHKKTTWPSRSLAQFTLSTETLLKALIRQQLFIKLFSACVDSLAGEHESRLMSMQVAEKNIKQHLETLTAIYRQQRQNQITEELLDVVSGFEALQNNDRIN